MQLDLEKFKLLFYKPAWREVEDLFEKIDDILFVIFVVKIVIQIINISFVWNVIFTIIFQKLYLKKIPNKFAFKNYTVYEILFLFSVDKSWRLQVKIKQNK